jgi:hypothetical protein
MDRGSQPVISCVYVCVFVCGEADFLFDDLVFFLAVPCVAWEWRGLA